MVDMSHKLCTYILAQDKKAKKEAKSKTKKDAKDGKKKSKSKKDGSGSDEDGKKKKKDKKKDKKVKKDKKEKKSESSSGHHLEGAIFGDDNKDDFDEDEEASLASEPGVDDAGAMRKSKGCIIA
jgi:translation initiation factor 5